MPTNIPAVQGSSKLINAEFVKLNVVNTANTQTSTTYYFSNSYKSEVINGEVYTALGGYLSVASQQRDLELTAYDTVITLVGVAQENIYAVLSPDTIIKGSTVEIWRGFYDENYILNTTTSPPVRRYRGIVTSYSLSEQREDRDNTYAISINCSNFKTVLENRIAGRFTNPTSWQTLGDANDTSMKNVPNLINANFDFGKPVGSQGQKTSGTNVYSERSV